MPRWVDRPGRLPVAALSERGLPPVGIAAWTPLLPSTTACIAGAASTPRSAQPATAAAGAAFTPRSPRSTPDPGCQNGFTLLELVLVIILVVLLFITAFDRLMPLRGDAEAAHVISTIGSLRSALGLAASAIVVADGLEALDQLAATNPIALLQQPPDNYAGTATEAAPGHWYFAPREGELRYRVRYPEYLAGGAQGPVELAWRIEIVGGDGPVGVRLVALDNARWPGHSRALRELAGHAGPDPSDR